MSNINNITGDTKSACLMLAEIADLLLQEDMRAHDMENVTMSRKGQYLSLVVPGLAERRPSLVHGDYIFAKLVNEDAREGISTYQVRTYLWKPPVS